MFFLQETRSSDNQDRLCYKISFVKCILLFIWYSYSPGVPDSSKEEKRLMWVFLLTDKKKKINKSSCHRVRRFLPLVMFLAAVNQVSYRVNELYHQLVIFRITSSCQRSDLFQNLSEELWHLVNNYRIMWFTRKLNRQSSSSNSC